MCARCPTNTKNERVYTLRDLREIGDEVYARRWQISKEHFAGMHALLDILQLLEARNKHTVKELLEDMDPGADDYPYL